MSGRLTFHPVRTLCSVSPSVWSACCNVGKVLPALGSGVFLWSLTLWHFSPTDMEGNSSGKDQTYVGKRSSRVVRSLQNSK